MNLRLLALSLSLGIMASLSACGPASQEYGLCTYMGACPACDEDDEDCKSDNTPAPDTATHHNTHDILSPEAN